MGRKGCRAQGPVAGDELQQLRQKILNVDEVHPTESHERLARLILAGNNAPKMHLHIS